VLVKPPKIRTIAVVICAIGLATAGSLAQERGDQPLADTALDTSLTDECGGRSPNPTVPCERDVARMLLALPEAAPATPAKPRKVLVLGVSRGFQHSSIPLTVRTVEEMGKKTGAWTTDVSYHAGSINAKNLEQYDAIFLAHTTGTFLDEPNPFEEQAVQGVTDARRQAFLDFVRGGKGIAGIHAACDAYHGRVGPRTRPPFDRNAVPPPCTARVPTPGGGGGVSLWDDYIKLMGGYFKWHWMNPTAITVKIDDPDSPITAPFHGRSFNVADEVYTFNDASWSRENVHVLMSLDYSTLSDCEKGLESYPRPDHDYGLSWIRREGKGRVFYQALGHDESIYYNNPAMLEHILAGVQYALGDLEADDSPSR
jgi:type 1 glutamine amidotransferase